MNELVKIINNKEVVTDSLTVARYFNKKHQHVIEAIENLIDSLQDIGNKPITIFREVNTLKNTSKGRTGEKYYQMNRDGFSLLAMGFTGKEALVWKIKYITAFNETEAKLAKSQKQLEEAYRYIKDTFAPDNEDRGKLSETSKNPRLFPRRGAWVSRGRVLFLLDDGQPYLPTMEALFTNTKGTLSFQLL